MADLSNLPDPGDPGSDQGGDWAERLVAGIRAVNAEVEAGPDLSAVPYEMAYEQAGATRPAAAGTRHIVLVGGTKDDPTPTWLNRPYDRRIILRGS